MSAETSHLTHRIRTGTWLFVFTTFFGLAVFLQYQNGAFQAGFGSEPDEAAHYVTGLCIRDYIAAGFPGNPLAFAKNYYEHYPKVAIGHWPPGFYLIQSAWTLPFSPNRVSVMLLMAFMTALIAAILFELLKGEFGFVSGLFGAVLFLALPLTQRFSSAVMTEIPITLLALCALFFFAKFLDGEKPRDAIGFGVIASFAILTKQSALALAFIPVFAILLSRKIHLLKRPSFWIPAGIVLLLCGPWTVLTLKLASEGSWTEEGWGWPFTGKAVPFYLMKFYGALGLAITLLALIGLVSKLAERENPRRSFWISAAGLLIGTMLFHFIVPVGFEDRHLLPALPPAILFAAAGAVRIAQLCVQRGASAHIALAFILSGAAIAFGVETFRIPGKGYSGFGQVAEFVMKQGAPKDNVVLVASDARGEGMLISEIAMREKRPSHFVRRASKELAQSTWSGAGYQQKFANENDVLAHLRKKSIRYVVFDASLGKFARKAYHDLLEATLGQEPFVFEKAFPVERNGKWFERGIMVYRRES